MPHGGPRNSDQHQPGRPRQKFRHPGQLTNHNVPGQLHLLLLHPTHAVRDLQMVTPELKTHHPATTHLQLTRQWQRSLCRDLSPSSLKTTVHTERRGQTRPWPPIMTHTTFHLRELHWLPIQRRCQFKLLTHAYKAQQLQTCLHKPLPELSKTHQAPLLCFPLARPHALHPTKLEQRTLLLPSTEDVEWTPPTSPDLPISTGVPKVAEDLALRLNHWTQPAPGYLHGWQVALYKLTDGEVGRKCLILMRIWRYKESKTKLTNMRSKDESRV